MHTEDAIAELRRGGWDGPAGDLAGGLSPETVLRRLRDIGEADSDAARIVASIQDNHTTAERSDEAIVADVAELIGGDPDAFPAGAADALRRMLGCRNEAALAGCDRQSRVPCPGCGSTNIAADYREVVRYSGHVTRDDDGDVEFAFGDERRVLDDTDEFESYWCLECDTELTTSPDGQSLVAAP
jgi:hypothetical protein